MGDDEIVDSTKRGNISRYINHSCDVSWRVAFSCFVFYQSSFVFGRCFAACLINLKQQDGVVGVCAMSSTHLLYACVPCFALCSCPQPNCYTKVIEAEGENKIVVCARRYIGAGKPFAFAYLFVCVFLCHPIQHNHAIQPNPFNNIILSHFIFRFLSHAHAHAPPLSHTHTQTSIHLTLPCYVHIRRGGDVQLLLCL